nr:deaminase [Oceanisphaera litoralis]
MRFINLAQHVASWSKDPSTKVGAVVVRLDKTVATMGFNGLPRNAHDDHRLHNREVKIDLTVHAEMNALLFAREPLHGFTLYVWPLSPCVRCASHIIQAGITRVVSVPYGNGRWQESLAKAEALFSETGVVVDYVLTDD